MPLMVPLPVVVPIVAAVVIAGFGRFVRSRLVDVGAIAVAAAVGVIAVVLLNESIEHTSTYWFGGWAPVDGVAIGIAFVVQPYAAGFCVLAAVVTLVSLIFAYRYFDEVGALAHVLVLVFLAALCGFALSGDLFNMFVFFELMSVTAFALTAYRSDEEAPLQGAMNFAVSNTVAAFLILFGIGLLYGRTGALNLRQVGAILAGHPADALVVVAFALVVGGFLVKAAVVPFHFWLADAYTVAPAPAVVLFSAVMSDLGLYAVAEIYWTVFSGPLGAHAGAVRALLMALGALTAILGALMCVQQRDLKRMLAYATISHIGLFLLGIGLLDAVGLAGAFVYLFCDGLVKGGLFLAAGVLALDRGSGDELVLHGRGRGLPLLGLAMAAGGLALAALPPFGTFVGKALLEDAAVHEGAQWVPYVMLVVEAVTGGTVLRAAGRIFFGLGAVRDPLLTRQEDQERDDEPEHPPRRSTAQLTVPVAVLVIGGLALGFVPGLAVHAVAAAYRFVGRTDLAAVAAAPEPSITAYVFGAGASVAAVALAFAVLRLSHHADTARRVARGLRPLSAALRAVHSGDVRDYVTWLVVGVVAIGAAMVLALGF